MCAANSAARAHKSTPCALRELFHIFHRYTRSLLRGNVPAHRHRAHEIVKLKARASATISANILYTYTYTLFMCATTMLRDAVHRGIGAVTEDQLASPRGATDTSKAEANNRHRHHRREYHSHRRRSHVAAPRSAVVGRHRETTTSVGDPQEREKLATIIFHRQKRKGRMPFISPGSVGSHVVGAAACDTSITDQPACCIADGGDGTHRVYMSTWTSYTRLSPRVVFPYITDISPRTDHCAPILIFLLLLD